MHRHVFIALAIVAGAAGVRAQPALPAFYDTADSVSAHPPFRNELQTFCQVRLLDRWISFVGFKATKTVLYVTFTLDSVADPVADVSPIVDYEKARPVLGKVQTWGYPFDRNRDGKVDYLALVGGAAPYEDADFPADYPAKGAVMTLPHVELYLAKCKIVFNHWADDNYDGRLDATVQVDLDANRTWVYRQIVARQTKFDGAFDDVAAFRADGSAFSDTLTKSPAGFTYRGVSGASGWFGAQQLDEKSAIMALINQAAEKCGKGVFRLWDGTRVE